MCFPRRARHGTSLSLHRPGVAVSLYAAEGMNLFWLQSFCLLCHFEVVLAVKLSAAAGRCSDPATADNRDDSNKLLSVIKGSDEYAWIGLHDDLIRWKWALGNEDFNLKLI